MITTHEKFIFDLDRTVWDTYDITGRPIWAKQLIEPFHLDGNRMIDDVGSYCVLKDGIRQFIALLVSKNKKIGFLSVGALYGAPSDQQPSLKILKLFDLYDMFNDETILVYKTESKKKYLEKMGACVFFDDDEKHLKAASLIEKVKSIDSKSILDWSELT